MTTSHEAPVSFPSHLPSQFPGGPDALEREIAGLKAALGAGSDLILCRDVAPDNVAELRDYVRFVDDELRGVWGIEFHLEEGTTSESLAAMAPFMAAASAECHAREVGFSWSGTGAPTDARPVQSPEDPDREIEPENVIVATLAPDESNTLEALERVLAPLGGLARFANPLRLSVGPAQLEAFAEEDPRDGLRLRHQARPTPWVLLNLGLYRKNTKRPLPQGDLLAALVQQCLTLGTLPHVALVVEDGAWAESTAVLDLEAFCAARKIPCLILCHDNVETVSGGHETGLTQAAAYGGGAQEALTFDYVIAVATVQAEPYLGALDQALAPWPPDHRQRLMASLSQRWTAEGEAGVPLTRWIGDSMAESLAGVHVGGLVGVALPTRNTATEERLAPWAQSARRHGVAVDLCRASRADLWVIEAPEAGVLIASTDPLPIDRLLVDAFGVESGEIPWLCEAVAAGDPYARHEGGLVHGDIPDTLLTGPSRPPKTRKKRGLTVLGIACTTLANHGATLLRDGEIVAAVQEERFRRRKQLGWHPRGRPEDTVVCDSSLPLERAYPWRSIEAVLSEGGLGFDDVDVVAYNGVWARFFPTYSLQDADRPPKTIKFGRQMFIPHHLSHAASTYRVSGMDGDAFIFTVDGRGERETAAFFEAKEGAIHRVFDVLCREDSLIGGVYEFITTILGFGHYGQGSTMGLAAMGRPTFDLSPFLSARNRRDHSIHDQGIMEAFGHLIREPGGKLTQDHVNLAASVQQALEDTVLNLISDGLGGRRPKNLCLAGGVALNCSMNQRIRTSLGVENIYVQPAAHDAGTSLGAALEAHWEITGEAVPTHMEDAHLGLGYSERTIEETLKAFRVPYERRPNIAQDVAELVADGKIVCWFQGRFEFGPRALGARSILADPRNPALKERLNGLKGRQSWRPFGPSMLAGYEDEYFELAFESPFMLFTFPVKRERWDEIPVVLHKDGTTRPQSVKKEVHPLYWEMIDSFRKLTGVPMVVNTSFNTAHEPIVATPEDAVGSFLDLGADVLAIGSFLVHRQRLKPL